MGQSLGAGSVLQRALPERSVPQPTSKSTLRTGRKIVNLGFRLPGHLRGPDKLHPRLTAVIDFAIPALRTQTRGAIRNLRRVAGS